MRGTGTTMRPSIAAWTDEWRLVWLRRVLAAAIACGLTLSWRLWTTARQFPLAPVAGWLPSVPSAVSLLWLVALLALLPAIALARRPRRPVLAFVAGAVLLCLWDQNRWQPWLYQYLALLSALGVLAWRSDDAGAERAALRTCRVIIACTYLWSGLQKLNVTFVRETWPDVTSAMARILPGAVPHVAAVALAAPLLEIAAGCGLIARRFRRPAVALALSTHAVILACLVASGENVVVWPWNLAMAAFAVVLFWREDEEAPALLLPKRPLHGVALLLFGVAPALSLVGLWDSYLSAALYSGSTQQAVIYLNRPILEQLPPSLRTHVWQRSTPYFLDLNRWSYGELGVPLYPEPRVFKQVASAVCRYAGQSAEVRLRILGNPSLLSGHRESTFFDCDHLD